MNNIPSYVLINKFDKDLLNNLSDKYEGIYASINDEFFMKVEKTNINEVLFLDETFIDNEPFNLVSFYFCKIKKENDKVIKEKPISRNLVLSEKVMTSKEYYETNGKSDGIREMLDGAEDIVLVTTSVVDSEGNRYRWTKPLYEDEYPVEKPKLLKLIN